MKPISILTPDINLLGVISNYESLMFTRKWHRDDGKLELRINRHKKYTDTLHKGNIIIVGNDPRKAYQILYRGIELDENGKVTENWHIIAHQLKSVVGRRITMPPVHTSHDNKSGAAESVIKHYINRNVVNPVDSRRKIPNLVIAPDLQRGMHVDWQSRFKNLAEETADISLLSGLGWDVYVDYETKKWVFDVYEGNDISVNQDVHDPVVFSPQFGNIKDMQFVDSDLNYRNVAVVAGQGEGVDRRVIEVGQATGLDRYETFVDARDVSEETDDEEPVQRPPADIERDLRNRGNQSLAEMSQEVYLEGQVLMGTKSEKVPKKVDGTTEDVRLDEVVYLRFAKASDKVRINPIQPDEYSTIECLYRHSNTSTTWRTLIASNESNRHPLIINPTGGLSIFDGAEKRFGYSVPKDNQFRRFTVVYKKGESARLYVDGQFISSIQTAINPIIYEIGNWPSGSYPAGDIGYVKAWNKALSTVEISDSSSNHDSLIGFWMIDKPLGSWRDFSGNENHGVVTGATHLFDYLPSTKTVDLLPIDLSKLGRYQSSKFTFNIDTPSGTSASVEYSLDNEVWHPLQSGGSLPFHEGDWLTDKVVYLRQMLSTTDQTVTPSISGFKYEINGYTLKNKVSTATFVYEEDWNLGDIPTLQNKDWGVTLDSRITEVTEVYEREGQQLSATFGQSRPTLISKIKQELSGMRNEIVR